MIILQLHFFTNNDKYSNGTKHIKINCFSIENKVKKQLVFIEHINIEIIISSLLTK